MPRRMIPCGLLLRQMIPPALILLGAVLLPSLALAQRPPAVVPSRDDTVLERLPRGYATLLPETTATDAAARLTQIQQLLETAARTGDARLAARADALLSDFPADSPNASIVRARAFAAQHRHDFDQAVRLLGQLIQIDPRDADARLSRAQILLVQGQLDGARRDCAMLAFRLDAGRGLLCTAALSLRSGDTDAAASMLDRWLVAAGPGDASRRYAQTMRAEVASRAGANNAQTHFERALALGSDDVRTLAAYARHLRGGGRHAQVLQLLANAPESDGLNLERALAAHASGRPDARALIAAQGRRYQLARAVGSEPELRDEAEFALTLSNDPQRALALALQNFATQRDSEDVDLLLRAAAAAKQPQALRALQVWAASQQLQLPPAIASSTEPKV